MNLLKFQSSPINNIANNKKIARKSGRNNMISLFIIMLFIWAVAYNLYDNNRIKVVEQSVVINKLPAPFDNFKILQITDLHEKSFGKEQKNLVDKINKLDYDIIVVTGDIVNNDSNNMKPFKDLMKGIRKKNLVFFTGGNNDPNVFVDGRETLFGKELKNLGCTLLNKPYAIRRNNDTLWILQYSYELGKKNSLCQGIKEEDITVGLNHFPADEETFNVFQKFNPLNFDLIIAGHYHGGQVRIPLLGALYITKGGLNGLFPREKEVSGLQEEGHLRQYVSRGLGASGPKLLAFRVFDTPEVNIITLKSK